MNVLVADDSITFRRVIAQSLESIDDTHVVGYASTGTAAVRKAVELRPDLITLDIEMPGMGGIEALDALRARGVTASVICVSALTLRGGALTLQALSKGAFDFITKPIDAGYEQNYQRIKSELTPRVRSLQQRLMVRKALAGSRSDEALSSAGASAPATSVSFNALRAQPTLIKKPEIVLIGVSTGGPNALSSLLPGLPRDLGVPVVIVQHMPPLFTRMLADNLNTNSQLPVREAAHGEVLSANRVYIAPGGKQMRIIAGPNGAKVIELTDDPPENNCRPAVDYLFRSVANCFPGEALAVILTGMGSDGTLGLRLLKRHGCKVLAQDEPTSVVFGMPKSAIEAGVVDAVLPISQIAPRIASLVRDPFA